MTHLPFVEANITEHRIANILAQGFVDDPSFEYILSNSENRLEALTAFYEPFVADGMKRGQIVVAEAELGACIWYPASVEIFGSEFEAMLKEVNDIILHLAGLEATRRFEHLIQKIGAAEPTEPHCEVFFIGLKKEARGKGIGSNLLKPVLNYADTNQVGCYLVSSNSRNISFYERHGFEKYCPIQISDSYSMTGMWRRDNNCHQHQIR